MKFFFGPMDCGKSTLALQVDYNHRRQGRHGLLLTRHDRAGPAQVSSRLGFGRPAVELDDDTDLIELVRRAREPAGRIAYLVVDEAQFLRPEQVEQLATLADDCGIEVFAFGIATDFRSRLFPGTQRLFELADAVAPLHLEVLCWCGARGQFNGRVVDGQLVREGVTVVIGDTGTQAPGSHYQVLCRAHYRTGRLGPPDRP